MAGAYLGDFPTSATVYVYFDTFASTGASVTITGLAVTDIEIYKDGGTTQRASEAGYTLLDTDGIDFDGLTGIHGFKIDLSDDTDAGFYAAGHEYTVVVSAVTCDSQTISFVACHFSIERAGGALALLKSGTYGLSAASTAVSTVDSKVVSSTTLISTAVSTVDSKVVSATTLVSTAVSTVDSKITSVGVVAGSGSTSGAVSTVDSKVTSVGVVVGSGSSSAAVSTVDSKVDSATAVVSTAVSTVDSKVVSATTLVSTVVSTVDSKVVSATTLLSGAVSTADSKIASVGVVAGSGSTSAAVSTVDSKIVSSTTLLSGAVSTADSKITSVGTVAGSGATSTAVSTVGSQVASVGTVAGTTGVMVGNFTTAAKALVQTEAEDALKAYDLDHLIETTAGSEEPTDGSYLDQIMHKDSNQTFSSGTDSLEAIGDVTGAGSVAVTVASAVDGGTVTCTIAADLSAAVSGLTIDENWTKVYLTVKEDLSGADSTAILQMVETNPSASTTDGTLYVNGAAATSTQRTQGTLTVDQSGGSVTVVMDEALTAAFVEQYGLQYDLKEIYSGDVLCTGRWHFSYTPTKSVT